MKPLVVIFALAVAALAWRALPGASRHTANVQPQAAPYDLLIPRVHALPKLDGELDDALWQGPVARTGAFLNEQGVSARPYSDARIAWGEDHIILALYAGDEDIRTSGSAKDLFRVTLGATTFEISATGALVGAPAGTRVAVDQDGTLDNSSDDDEEWVVELVIPLRSLGLEGKSGERIAFAAERCDTTHDGVRRCGAVHARSLALVSTH